MTIYTCFQLPMISQYCSLSSDLVGGFLQLFFVGTQTRAQTSKGIGRSWHHWVANLLCRFQRIRYLKDAHKYYTARIVNTCYNTLKYTINLRWLCRMYHLSLIGYRKKMIFFFFLVIGSLLTPQRYWVQSSHWSPSVCQQRAVCPLWPWWTPLRFPGPLLHISPGRHAGIIRLLTAAQTPIQSDVWLTMQAI